MALSCGAVVCRRGTYYLRRSSSLETYKFVQSLSSGTYWGKFDHAGKYVGDAGTSDGFTIRCLCEAGQKKRAMCDCAPGLRLGDDGLCKSCDLGSVVQPGTSTCQPCPANSDMSVGSKECDMLGCHVWDFVMEKDGDLETWYMDQFTHVDGDPENGVPTTYLGTKGRNWYCEGEGCVASAAVGVRRTPVVAALRR